MRTKNHHLLLRGHLWHLKLRIPVDLYDQYSERLSKFIEEPLKTTDVVAARALRDQRLAKYQRLWTEMRIKKGRDVVGNQVQVSARSTDPDEIDYLISVYGDRIDKLAEAKALANGADDLVD